MTRSKREARRSAPGASTSSRSAPWVSPYLKKLATAPKGVVIGRNVETSKHFALPLSDFARHVELLGEIGAGKTSITMEMLYTLAFGPTPILWLDYIGSGFKGLQAFVGFMGTILGSIDRLYPEHRLHLAQTFLRRFAFVNISNSARTPTGFDLPVCFDILKRRTIGERLEACAEVTERLVRVFNARFADAGMRVQFQRVFAAVITTLVAAGAPIKDWEIALEGGEYMSRLLRAHDRLGTAADPYVRTQVQELLSIQSLKSPKSRRAFDDAVNSTRNALAQWRPGTILGELFSGPETFALESTVFGRKRLFVTTDLSDTVLRKEAFLALWATESAIIAGRLPSIHDVSRMIVGVDEIGWVERPLIDQLAEVRNLKVSLVVSHQSTAQWRHLDMAAMADMAPAVFPTRFIFRPTTFPEAQDLALAHELIDPMGRIIRETVQSESEAEAHGENIGETWGEMRQEATSWNEGIADVEPDEHTTGRRTTSAADGGSSGQSRSSGGQRGNSKTDTRTKATVETLIRIPFEEQRSHRAQVLMQRPRFHASVVRGGTATTVALYPPRTYPDSIFGVDITAHYKAWHDGYWGSRAAPPSAPAPAVVRSIVDVPMAVPPPQPPAPPRTSDPIEPTTAEASIVLKDCTIAELAVASAAISRFTTGHQLMLLEPSCTYDSAMRALSKAVRSGKLAQLRPPVARGGGSAPILHALTEKGARAAAALGFDIEAMQRLGRSVLAQKRAVEEGAPTLLRHQRFVGWLVDLLVSHLRSIDDAAAIDVVSWDPVIEVALREIAPQLSEAARKRVEIDAKGNFNYRPDAVVVATWNANGERLTQPFAIEVETGYGDQPQALVGEVKAACIAVAARQLRSARALLGRPFAARTPLRTIVWHRRKEDAPRFLEGAARVRAALGSAIPILASNADALPLWLPKGTAKADLRAAVNDLTETFASAVFTTADGERRPLLPRGENAEEQGNA